MLERNLMNLCFSEGGYEVRITSKVDSLPARIAATNVQPDPNGAQLVDEFVQDLICPFTLLG
jgi:hypothetical protein